VSTSTPSPSSQRNTSHPVHATSHVSTRQPFNSLSQLTQSALAALLRSACMQLTTTFSESCQAWAVSHTPTKRDN
jgi:hypothetical protein